MSVLLLAAPYRAGGEQPTIVTFDGAKAGSLPAGFRAMSSSDQEPGRWEVGKVGPLAVLSQSEIGRRGYRLAILQDVRMRDLSVGVRVRVGDGDRAAGVAWRVQNPDNYYAARVDFDRREVVLYKFVGGNRIRLAGVSGLRLDAGAWHDLLVEHEETRIRVWLNGIPVASSRDGSLRDAGRIGFWMPGDGTAHFSRLWYQPLPRDR